MYCNHYTKPLSFLGLRRVCTVTVTYGCKGFGGDLEAVCKDLGRKSGICLVMVWLKSLG